MSTVGETLSGFLSQGRLRSLRTLPQAGSRIEIEGKQYLNFSSNDYFSLSQDERVKRAAADAIFKWGTSASASRLVTGDLSIHSELEYELADYFSQESCLVFGSGFLANIGVLTALVGRGDQIFSDKLNHASLIDGALQSRADVYRYKHSDINDLQRLILENPTKGARLIVTESIFSMDGDIAPLEEIAQIASETNSTLLIDEAHAVGVFGPGIFSRIKKCPEKLVIVGTLSKALGSYGGFVACSNELRSYFVNTARSFIYSTSLPPSSCAAALAAIKIIRNDSNLGHSLISKSKVLYSALAKVDNLLLPFASQIIPVVVKDNVKSMEIAQSLFEEGIICSAIRPPTVPPNSSRLRLSVNLAHTNEEILQVAEVIVKLLAS